MKNETIFQNFKQYFNLQNIFFFTILFSVLIFRVPGDFFTPYLWAEDGTVLIQSSIYYGLKGIFIPNCGTYFVVQKTLALLCYWLVIPSGNITYLPYIMQIVFKSVSVLAVLYFINDRFSWLIEKKVHRFFICILIVLLMPQNSSDVLTVDTSLPFELFFAAFLIGLDSLCSGKKARLTFWQTIFLLILSLSFAGAICIVAMCFVIFLQWAYKQFVSKTINKTTLFFEILKLCCFIFVAFLQTKSAIDAGRVSMDLDIFNRLVLNTKNFMFFPYWHRFHSWGAFVIGFILFGYITYMSKINWKIFFYSCFFSYCFMLYCSMVMKSNDFYSGEMTGRYVFTCFEIAAFIIGCCIVCLIKDKKNMKIFMAGAVITVLCIVALRTYNVTLIGANFANNYKVNSCLFDVNGQDAIQMPIGPWEPWSLTVPANFSDYKLDNDLEFLVEDLDGIWVLNDDFGNWRGAGIAGSVNFSGWIRTGQKGQLLIRLFVKNDSTYIAASEITIREYFQSDQVEYLQHNGFKFNISQPYNFFSDGVTTIELVGETEDGRWHYGKLDIPTNHVQ